MNKIVIFFEHSNIQSELHKYESKLNLSFSTRYRITGTKSLIDNNKKKNKASPFVVHLFVNLSLNVRYRVTSWYHVFVSYLFFLKLNR